jgi:hypothetical protein
MSRRQFGLWGLGLPAEELSAAVAALGVAVARWPEAGAARILDQIRDPDVLLPSGPGPTPAIWDLSPLYDGEPDPWSDRARVPPADLLAAAWHEAVSGMPEEPWMEIEIRPGTWHLDLAWFSDLLLMPSVRARSAYVRLDGSSPVDWQWPIRLAFIEDDASARLRAALVQELHAASWLQPLVEVLPSGRPGPSDLLVLPEGLGGGTAELLLARESIACNCVLFLRGLDEPWRRVPSLVSAVRSLIATAGLAFGRVGEHQAMEWLTGLIAELSHNRRFGPALQWPRRGLPLRRALLFAQPELLADETVGKVRHDLERLLAQTSRSVRKLEPAGGVPESTSSDERRALVDRLGADLSFSQETGGATEVSDIARRAGPLRMAGSRPELRASRFIRAQLFDLSDPAEPRRLSAGLRASSPHAVDVFIGPRGARGVGADQPFPEEKLPPRPTDHVLTVVFSEPAVSPDPQVGTLSLPPQGSSTACRFFFKLGDGATRIEARISILYRNRVLQTAILKGRVVDRPEDSDVKPTLEVAVEAMVRPRLFDLDARRPFDAALVLNHTPDGSPMVTAVSGDRAEAISLTPSMDTEIQWFSDMLSRIAMSPDSYGSLTADGTVKLLRTLAQHGHLLYAAIVGDWHLSDRITRAARIQVLAMRPDAFLPLEFAYEKASPREDAVLCPGAAESLASGRCPPSCPPNDDQKGVVCPMAFWCLSRVIERHAHDPRVSLGGKDFGLQAEPASDRATLPIYSRALLGASSRVDSVIPGGVEEVGQLLNQATNHQSQQVEAWDGWTVEVKTGAPSLMVLLVHHDLAANDLPEIEIGEGKFLSVGDLDAEYVVGPDKQRNPVVLLIGCTTAREKVEFHSFVAGFRRNGAAAVVGTLATILGRHATPVARGLVQALDELMRANTMTDGVVLGDALLAVRRRLLGEGVPMALCLVAYGDADWRLVPARS